MEEERVNYARKTLAKVDVEDVARYAHDKFNFDMFDVQKEILRNMCSGKSVWTSRGIGRTRIVYILANYLADKYNDIFLPIYVIKKLEYNNKPETADVRYPYTVCVKAGLAPLWFFEEMKSRLPEEQFNREYRGI